MRRQRSRTGTTMSRCWKTLAARPSKSWRTSRPLTCGCLSQTPACARVSCCLPWSAHSDSPRDRSAEGGWSLLVSGLHAAAAPFDMRLPCRLQLGSCGR